MAEGQRYKVVIVAPSEMVATGLRRILEESGQFTVVAHLKDMEQLAERVKLRRPSVVVIDPVTIRYGRRVSLYDLYPFLSDLTSVALVGGYVDEATLMQHDGTIGIYDEASAIVRKILQAIRSSAASAGSRMSDSDLSAREREVLVAVAKGMMNKQIAENFHISVNTVMTHRKAIVRKTGIKTVAGLTVYALLNNYLSQSDI